jgi:lipopolysaccharide transport system permease protein
LASAPARSGAGRNLRLVDYFARRAIEKNYARTRLGKPWLLIRPLMDSGGKALIFGGVLSVPSNGVPYFLFLLAGMSTWRLFDRALYWGTRSLELNRRLTAQLYFPRLILPVAHLAPGIVDYVIYSAVMLVVAGYYGITDHDFYLRGGIHPLVTVAAVLLCLAFACALALWTSVIGERYRDVRFTLHYVLEFWFFVTPVLFPLSAVPHGIRPLAAANPMTGIVQMAKWGLLGIDSLDPLVIGWSVFATLAFGVLGIRFFRRAERRRLSA